MFFGNPELQQYISQPESICGLLPLFEVKIVGYLWAFIEAEANKSRGQYSPFLTEQDWSTKNFYRITKPRTLYFRWSQKVISILAFRVTVNDLVYPAPALKKQALHY